MPIWSEILSELNQSSQNGRPDYDAVRRKYLLELYKYTNKRNVILYATSWQQKPEILSPSQVSIADEDIQALMEVCYGLENKNLDLILHSPGGSLEATEAIVSYLRSRFSHIRVIVPVVAMSAATMLACAADEIILGEHSFLGPIDPQLLIRTQSVERSVPAEAVLDDFKRAQRECTEPEKISSWLPLLSQYGPGLLTQCESVQKLSKELVKTWLETYMFKDDKDRESKAEAISEWLRNHKLFKSHSRHLSRKELQERGLTVKNLEEDQIFQDLCLSVFHATTHTFSGTPALKIVENHVGRAFVKMLPVTFQKEKKNQPGKV